MPITPVILNTLFIIVFLKDTHTPIINNKTDIIPIGLNKLPNPDIS